MKTLHHILCATDFSPPSRHAADRAARLARETGATLTLLHVTPAPAWQALQQWLGASHASARQLDEQRRLELDTLASELTDGHHGRPLATHRTGVVVDAIVDEAAALGTDLIVLAARGASFLRRLAIGTTSERLVRRARQPVLVVRTSARAVYRRALVAVDFSPWSRPALDAARRVAPHAEWTLFAAYSVPFEAKLRFAGVDEAVVDHYRRVARDHATRQLHALAADAGLVPSQWRPCIVEGEASLRLLEQEQTQDADLVVLGKHGQSAAEDLLLGSVTQHVLAEGSCDVLITPVPDEPGRPRPRISTLDAPPLERGDG